MPTSSQPIKWWFPRNNTLVFMTDVGWEDSPLPGMRRVRVRLNRPPPPLPAQLRLQMSEHRPVRQFSPGRNYRTRGHKKPRETWYLGTEVSLLPDEFGGYTDLALPGVFDFQKYMRVVFIPNAFVVQPVVVLMPAFAYADLDEHDVSEPPWPPAV